MQVVMLVAGKGTRMGPLTQAPDGLPKPLLEIDGVTLIEWKLRNLPLICTEVIMVVHHLAHKIEGRFGASYHGIKISYVDAEALGTAYAVWAVKDLITGPFMVICGDDLYTREDLAKCAEYPYSILIHGSDGPVSGGKVLLDKNLHVLNIVEGTHPDGGAVWAGVYVLQPDIFDLPMVPKAPGSDEFGLPQTLLQLKDRDMTAVFARNWYQVTAPEDLNPSEEVLRPFR